MYVTTVIPIARGISRDELTYVSAIKINPGSIIEVPLRKKIVKAIVLDCQDARTKKMSLRMSTFSLKKIKTSDIKDGFSVSKMLLVKNISDYFASSLGSTLFALNHKYIFDIKEIDTNSFQKKITTENIKGGVNNKIVEANYDKRMYKYEEIIKKNIIENKKTVMLFPTIDALRKSQELVINNDFKKKSIYFHSKMTKKLFQKNIEKMNTTESLLILMTANFLLLVPEGCKTLIMEEENSRWYKMRNRPYLDIRIVIDLMKKIFDFDLIYGDILVSSSLAISSKVNKQKNNPELKIITFGWPRAEEQEKKIFALFNDQMIREITRSTKQDKKVFIWVPRKGYAPIVLCEHCSNVVKCSICDAPVVLYKGISNKENYFLCHHCGEKRSALEKCKICDSWKLGAYGIGIDKVKEEISKLFPKELNSETIVIGTEKIITEIRDVYDLTLIPSIDSLLSIPDFNIDEQLLRTMLLLKEKTLRLMIIRTKHKDLDIIGFLKKQNLKDFHVQDLSKRKMFNYSPYKILIKISSSGKKDKVSEEIRLIKNDLAKWKPTVFPAFIKTIKNDFKIHLLLKIDPEEWPNEQLLNYLRLLPPSIDINVEPNSLL